MNKSQIKIIITGATGMVGEGVLLECIQNSDVSEILVVGRKSCGIKDTKLKEVLVSDFMKLDEIADQLAGYDACFYCAGISSVGMDEAKYTNITYDVTMNFAKTLVEKNPNMVFDFVSGAHTDSSEAGKLMRARVKGKTENDLIKLNFEGVYNFRPGFMKPMPNQKNVKRFFKPVILLFPLLFPKKSLTLKQVAQAMINSKIKGYPKHILEIEDIVDLAK